jgi:hypothetical protein
VLNSEEFVPNSGEQFPQAADPHNSREFPQNSSARPNSGDSGNCGNRFHEQNEPIVTPFDGQED